MSSVSPSTVSSGSTASSTNIYLPSKHAEIDTRFVTAGGHWSVPAKEIPTRNWDEEWHRVQDMPTTSQETIQLRNQLLQIISNDFAEFVRPTAELLINERWMPATSKSLPPISVVPSDAVVQKEVLASISSHTDIGTLSEFKLQQHNSMSSLSDALNTPIDGRSRNSSNSSLPPVVDISDMAAFHSDNIQQINQKQHHMSEKEKEMRKRTYVLPDIALKVSQISTCDADELYFSQGVFFKFAAVTPKNQKVFNNPFVAHKVVANERRNCAAVSVLDSTDIHVPLMAIIDYKGERMIASAHMDGIASQPVVYGTLDNGLECVNTSSRFDGAMERVAAQLHLAAHQTPCTLPDQELELGYWTSDSEDEQSADEDAGQSRRSSSFKKALRKKSKSLKKLRKRSSMRLKRKLSSGKNDNLDVPDDGWDSDDDDVGECVQLFGPSDMHGYVGTEGRLYGVHLARLMPAQKPLHEVQAFFVSALPEAPIAELTFSINNWHQEIIETLNVGEVWGVDVPGGDKLFMSISAKIRAEESLQKKQDEAAGLVQGSEPVDTEATQDSEQGNATPSIVIHTADGRKKRLKRIDSVSSFASTEETTPEFNVRASAIAQQPVVGDAIIVHWPRTQLLTHQFRPEFMKALNAKQESEVEPLNSDAYSQFGRVGHKRHNANSDAATLLMDAQIELCAAALDEMRQQVTASSDLIPIIHEYGINVRFLGKIRKQCKSARIRCLLLCEMVARVIKTTIRFSFRHLNRTGEFRMEPYIEAVLYHFNAALGTSPASQLFWKELIKVSLQSKFGHGCLFDREQNTDFNLSASILKSQLLTSLQNATGIQLDSDSLVSLLSDRKQFDLEQPLAARDLAENFLEKSCSVKPMVHDVKVQGEMDMHEHKYMLQTIRDYQSPWAKVDELLGITKPEKHTKSKKSDFDAGESYTIFYAVAQGWLMGKDAIEGQQSNPLRDVLAQVTQIPEKERTFKTLKDDGAQGLLEVDVAIGRTSSDSRRSDAEWDIIDDEEFPDHHDEMKWGSQNSSPKPKQEEESPLDLVKNFFGRARSKIKSSGLLE